MSGIRLSAHPLKTGIKGILSQHFDDGLVGRFELLFEVEKYNDESPNIWKQKKDQNLILEVYYRHPAGLMEYICDIFTWMSKKECEVKLLRYITDKVKAGVIGKDWGVKGNKFSDDIKSGKYETPNEGEKGGR